MSDKYLLQARDSVDGQLYTWLGTSDADESGYPGPNDPTERCVLLAPASPSAALALPTSPLHHFQSFFATPTPSSPTGNIESQWATLDDMVAGAGFPGYVQGFVQDSSGVTGSSIPDGLTVSVRGGGLSSVTGFVLGDNCVVDARDFNQVAGVSVASPSNAGSLRIIGGAALSGGERNAQITGIDAANYDVDLERVTVIGNVSGAALLWNNCDHNAPDGGDITSNAGLSKFVGCTFKSSGAYTHTVNGDGGVFLTCEFPCSSNLALVCASVTTFDPYSFIRAIDAGIVVSSPENVEIAGAYVREVSATGFVLASGDNTLEVALPDALSDSGNFKISAQCSYCSTDARIIIVHRCKVKSGSPGTIVIRFTSDDVGTVDLKFNVWIGAQL